MNQEPLRKDWFAMDYNEYKNFVLEKYGSDSSIFPKEWCISEKLVRKVSPEGLLKPFYGYTSVFKLDDNDIAKCQSLHDMFMDRIGGLVVDLPAETYHITLHTFWNQNNSGSIDNVENRMAVSLPLIKDAFKTIRKDYAGKKIHMTALGVSSDGSDVISIKFLPSAEKDYELLMSLFLEMEKICPLGQIYLPHVSLGYFQARMYSDEEIACIFSSISKFSKGYGFEIAMDVDHLVAESHERMDCYQEMKGI